MKSIHTCIICKKKTINKMYCSMKCRDKHRFEKSHETRSCKLCNTEFKTYIRDTKLYCSVKCASLSDEVRLKKSISVKKIMNSRYGVNSYSQTSDFKKKYKKTINKKYGVEHYYQSDDFKIKCKKTMNEKYGVDYPQQSTFIKQKTKKTVDMKYGGFPMETKKFTLSMIRKYGVDTPMKIPGITNKIQSTNLQKYGISSPLCDTKKQQKNLQDKYGVINISQLPHIKEKIQNTKLHNSFNTVLQRCRGIVQPLFDIHLFSGVGYYDKKFDFKCLVCNEIFKDYLYSGNIPRCPNCYPLIKGSSFSEIELWNFIKSILPHEIVCRNDRTVLQGKELDIYIPKYKLAIEYDGLYWHSELNGKDKNYHLRKTIECESVGVRLIHIFEDEWIKKPEIVKRRLKHILKVSTCKKIYARNTIINEISPQIKNDFLEKYHIQGSDKSSIKLGAFYESELVAVMTFSKFRIALGSKNSDHDKYELSRFATKYTVVGIAGKLLKFFIKNYNPTHIISYSDRRWGSGSVYDQLGFTKVSIGSPGYWYIKGHNRLHRFSFRKSVLQTKLKTFDENLTEWENMQLNGYNRIWDCGHVKYEMVI